MSLRDRYRMPEQERPMNREERRKTAKLEQKRRTMLAQMMWKRKENKRIREEKKRLREERDRKRERLKNEQKKGDLE